MSGFFFESLLHDPAAPRPEERERPPASALGGDSAERAADALADFVLSGAAAATSSADPAAHAGGDGDLAHADGAVAGGAAGLAHADGAGAIAHAGGAAGLAHAGGAAAVALKPDAGRAHAATAGHAQLAGARTAGAAPRGPVAPRAGFDFRRVRVHDGAASGVGPVHPNAHEPHPAAPHDARRRRHDAAALTPPTAPRAAARPRRPPRLLDPAAPSRAAPGLSQATVDAAHLHLQRGAWQAALDTIVDELARRGTLERARLGDGRMHAQPELEQAAAVPRAPTDPRRAPSGALRQPARLDGHAFARDVPWLYRSVLREYQRLLQVDDRRGLPTLTVVSGRPREPLLRDQQEVETYAIVLLQARLTGEFAHPRDIREDWRRVHAHWSLLRPSEQRPLRDLYVRAHALAEAILGGPGTLPSYAPGAP